MLPLRSHQYVTRSISTVKLLRCRSPQSQPFGAHNLTHYTSIKCPRYYSPSLLFNSSAKEVPDFLEQFLTTHNPPFESINYFNALEWSRKVLENPRYKPIAFYPRHLDKSTGENTFFAQTINSENTFPHVLALQLNDIKLPASAPASIATAEIPSHKTISLSPDNPEVICLMSLGKGLAANISTVHGGVQCVIFDEVVRLLVMLHHINVREPGPRDSHFTVQMNTRYIAPVRTLSDVLVRAWLLRWEGRKWIAKAQILSDTGLLLTECESIWVTAKRPS